MKQPRNGNGQTKEPLLSSISHRFEASSIAHKRFLGEPTAKSPNKLRSRIESGLVTFHMAKKMKLSILVRSPSMCRMGGLGTGITGEEIHNLKHKMGMA